MKSSKIKAGTVVLRWNGVSRDKGVVFKVTKKYATILWSGVKEKVEKDTLKWQRRYDYDKEEWLWYWIAPALEIEQTFTKKIEGDWIVTYNSAGKWVSRKLTPEAWKETFWFLRKPHELLIEQGYSISKERATQLKTFGDNHWPTIFSWFDCSVRDRSHGEEFIKWMIGPLAELMIEHEITDMRRWGIGLPFHGAVFGLLVEKVVNKDITATMGKDVLRRMFDGEELEKILEDDKYKISSDDDITKFIKEVIEANPGQVEELKAGKEKILMWLVGQVMKVSRGKANAANAKEMLIKELNL